MAQVDLGQLQSQRNGSEYFAIPYKNVCPQKTTSFVNWNMGFTCPAEILSA